MTMLTLSPFRFDNDNCRAYLRAEENEFLYCYLKEGRNAFGLYECTDAGEPLAPIEPDVSIYLSGELESDGSKIGDEWVQWASATFYMPSDLSPNLGY